MGETRREIEDNVSQTDNTFSEFSSGLQQDAKFMESLRTSYSDLKGSEVKPMLEGFALLESNTKDSGPTLDMSKVSIGEFDKAVEGRELVNSDGDTVRQFKMNINGQDHTVYGTTKGSGETTFFDKDLNIIGRWARNGNPPEPGQADNRGWALQTLRPDGTTIAVKEFRDDRKTHTRTITCNQQGEPVEIKNYDTKVPTKEPYSSVENMMRNLPNGKITYGDKGNEISSLSQAKASLQKFLANKAKHQ